MANIWLVLEWLRYDFNVLIGMTVFARQFFSLFFFLGGLVACSILTIGEGGRGFGEIFPDIYIF